MLLATQATTEGSRRTFTGLADSWTQLAAELEDAQALLGALSEIDLKDVPEPESLSLAGNGGLLPNQ
jgi:hypothetical protein